MVKRIKKQILSFMIARGFKEMSKGFYFIKNKILFCILFEKPSSTVYVNFFIWPLYMPCDCIYMTYGNRMNNVPYFNLPYLDNNATDEEFLVWCDKLCGIMDEFILVYFEKISTPEKLADYIKKCSRKKPCFLLPIIF